MLFFLILYLVRFFQQIVLSIRIFLKQLNATAESRLAADTRKQSSLCAVCSLAAIWNMLSTLEPYSAKGYLADKLTEHSVVISKSEGLALLRK